MSSCPSLTSDIQQARRGEPGALDRLLSPLKPYARYLTQRFFVPGWEREDLYQEALAGFVSALWGFEAERASSFENYARLSMRNAVVASVRHATRRKRAPRQATTSLEALHSAASDRFDPDRLVTGQVECQEILGRLQRALSPCEWKVLQGVLQGASLSEVALAEGLTRRATENALSRARAKARKLLDSPQVSRAV